MSFAQRKVGSGFNDPNSFLRWAEMNAGAKGNAPGFNSQFQYPLGANTNTNGEYIDGSFDSGKAIPQNSWQNSMDYHSMVPDIPFDQKATEKQQNNLMAFGLAALVVGIILFQSRGY